MGYRSEVKIVTTREGYDQMCERVDTLSEIDECGLPYEFCRIGESWDDIEFRTSCNNDELALHVEPSVAIEIV